MKALEVIAKIIGGVLGLALVWGPIYVGAHFVIKYW